MNQTIISCASDILELSEQASDSVESTGEYDTHFDLINSLDNYSVSMAQLLINDGLFLEEANHIIQLSSDAELSVSETGDYDANFDILSKLESVAVSLAYQVLSVNQQ